MPPQPSHDRAGKGAILGTLTGAGIGAGAGYHGSEYIKNLIRAQMNPLESNFFEHAPEFLFEQARNINRGAGSGVGNLVGSGIRGLLRSSPLRMAGLLGAGGATLLGLGGLAGGSALDWLHNHHNRNQWSDTVPGKLSHLLHSKTASAKYAFSRALMSAGRFAGGAGRLVGNDLGRAGRFMLTPKGMGIGAGLGAVGYGAWKLNKGINSLMSGPTGAFGAHSGATNLTPNTP